MSAVSVLALAALAQAGGIGRVTTVQLPAGERVRDARTADLDGDGRMDLVVLAARGEDFERELRIHRGRDGEPTFAQAPDHVLALTPDAVGFALGDVHADPGNEVVLFTARGAFAWRPAAKEGERYVRLGAASFLWQLPDPDGLLAWQPGVRDLDGGGLDDLLLPEPMGFRLLYQARAADGTASFPREEVLRVPPAELVLERRRAIRTEDGATQDAEGQRKRRFELSIGGRGDVADVSYWAGPLLTIDDRTPAPQLFDWDGDGDLDLFVQTPRLLLVWRRGADGFDEDPSLRFDLPVEVDRGRRLDISYHAALAHLDDDRRVDCVIFAGDKRSTDVRTQVLVFAQDVSAEDSPLFGEEGRPSQVLVLAGFAGVPRLLDVNGDRRDDLVVGSIRPDLFDTITGAASDGIDAEFYVYLNRGGAFSRRPDLTATVRISTEREFRSTVRFVGDVSGDGVQELLLREDAEKLALHLVRARDDGLQLFERPLWELAVHEEARLKFAPRPDGPNDLLVLEREQVLHVRFGR